MRAERVADPTEARLQAAAALVTACAVWVALLAPLPAPAPHTPMQAPKPSTVALSMVEEAPPPPQAAPPPPPPPEEPPPPERSAAPAPLPAPPPRRHVPRPHRKPEPRPPVEAPPQPERVVAPTRPDAGRIAQQAPQNTSAIGAFIARLHAIVARGTVPPDTPAWRMRHPSGEALVGFTLSRNGALSGVRLLRGSGNDLLDRAALAIVARQAFPAMPADVYPREDRHEFEVPVQFAPQGQAEGL